MSVLLSDEEIQMAVLGAMAGVPAYGSGAAEHWKTEYRAIAKAQLKKVYDEFESAGISEINSEGTYFWNPSKFRAFWQALLEEIDGI